MACPLSLEQSLQSFVVPLATTLLTSKFLNSFNPKCFYIAGDNCYFENHVIVNSLYDKEVKGHKYDDLFGLGERLL